MTYLERTLAHADLSIRSDGDGRTVHGLAVPFDREATVDDGFGPYSEVFRRGAFARTINAGVNRVKLLGNHDRRKFPLGAATMLREDTAGLLGEFRVSKTREGDDALELVRDGAFDSFSVSFTPVKERKTGKSMIERLEVKLREVSLVAFPAYEGAAIAGVRAQLSEHLTDEELERLLALALRRLHLRDAGLPPHLPGDPR
jgi:HK97 family phage prohead protease